MAQHANQPCPPVPSWPPLCGLSSAKCRCFTVVLVMKCFISLHHTSSLAVTAAVTACCFLCRPQPGCRPLVAKCRLSAAT